MTPGMTPGMNSNSRPGTKPLVYFNKNFSVTTAQLEALRKGGRFRSLASHTDPQHPMLLAADQTVLEKKFLGGQKYLQVMLEICERHGVAVFLVGKEREFLADHIADFAAIGTQLVVPASRATQDLLEAKDEFLIGLPNILPIPAWCTFNGLASFKRGIEQLKSDPAFVPGKTRLCVKPAKGIYASGFRVLLEKPNLRSFLDGELYQMTYAEAERMFDQPKLPKMLLMHTLEGAERSIDCVAWRGKLASCVVRRKGGEGQLIEDRPDLVEAARALTAHYQLSGIFNFQTKDHQRQPNLLEINARASGGLRYSMAAGVNFPEIAARLALGDLLAGDAAQPKTGIRVIETKQALVLPDVLEVPA
jgi:ATP-grasp in the biosynthetic pathway with Ter operon